MKLITSFSKFLEDIVNLNPTRVEVADRSIGTMTNILKTNQLFKGNFVNTTPQGSIRQRTIIKPAKPDKDFDVDLLFELEPFEGWEPKDYLLKLANEFRGMDRYKDKVDTRGKNRCVTIDYESDFHIDIVPAIETRYGYVVMNKQTNQFEPTDGDGYANWFEGKSRIVGGDILASVVRLLKYVRDAKDAFDAKSILLTTLMGHQVLGTDVRATHYPDLPTAFLTMISRLDQFLQANPAMPKIDNPALPGENFNRHWDQTKYKRFCENIHEYAALAREAYDENEDIDKSLEKWRKIFGETFPQPDEPETAPKGVIPRDEGEQFLSDFGISEDLKYSLRVDAKVEQDGFRPFMMRGSTYPLKKKRKLTFEIRGNFPETCSIKWKVKNYEREAKDARDLRGEITDDRGFKRKVEHTKYTGSHYVECYAIQGNVCVAKDRLIVPISNT